MSNYECIDTVVISCITNKAAGIEKAKLSHLDVLEVSNNNKQNFSAITSGMLEMID